jgi:hypothetical protein
MTIICSNCGEIPLSYITMGNRHLCCKCKREEYERELKDLQKRYVEYGG